jgi:BlaI family transcriptional regulator, penicillinase repressor
MRRHAHSETKAVLPTNAELLILDALWDLEEGTVEDVVERLPSNPRANYKTVQSLLRIMEHKGFVQHKTRGRAFVFTPRVSRDEVQRVLARRVLDRTFHGSYAAMLMNLLDGNQVKEQELDELEALIQRYRDQKSKGGTSE